jgi:hypothetical protein
VCIYSVVVYNCVYYCDTYLVIEAVVVQNAGVEPFEIPLPVDLGDAPDHANFGVCPVEQQGGGLLDTVYGIRYRYDCMII